jgi:hypothetical protein
VGLTGVITCTSTSRFASHILGKTDYGEIAVLWSAVFITVSTLYRPIDQLLSRHLRRRQPAADREPMRVARRSARLGVAFAVLALHSRTASGPPAEGNETLYWIHLPVLGYAASYFAHGYHNRQPPPGLFAHDPRRVDIPDHIRGDRRHRPLPRPVGGGTGDRRRPCLNLLVVPVFARRAQANAATGL